MVSEKETETVMPYGTAHGPDVRLCGQFTTHTPCAVKKIEKIFFCPFSSLFHPYPRHSSPKATTIFFSIKKSRVSQTVEGNKRNVKHEVPSRTRVARRRVTQKLDCFVDSDTFGDPSTVRSTWGLRRLRNRCRSANRIQSTLSVLHKS